MVQEDDAMLMALLGRLAEAWHTVLASVTDPYRPELHYMRGPGPRWRERHRKD
ncbi:hypothetical protein [Methylobacterium nodulans]|uniref:Uncharacterized protein n=1 Tax=Methylobacterium nodulans (strain LMG 21967 / CNCM I-2342 / ORS 2060) TaxID=460265 RepID=B8ICF3_METNO|nr:hypothetical protein [Methylobacterium nodulans]ACL55541.1 conserved hypothetical protein [Methylobacterium nodulans ORS 2060]